jgi:hypothetical protein
MGSAARLSAFPDSVVLETAPSRLGLRFWVAAVDSDESVAKEFEGRLGIPATPVQTA